MENEEVHSEFLKICKLKASLPVDIEFTDLSYTIKDKGEKHILKSVSGKFHSGELTAILGTSGAGKTTLLNVLSGYISEGVTGSIKINDIPRNMKTFRKISAYVMEETLLQPYLSVEELTIIAAKLKLGDHITLQQKKAMVKEVLSLLGLGNCLETWTNHLSGGERRRLSIALELVNNPPVIILDEPTSGLDTVSIKQCMEILQVLTEQGRTVICTIHQPSDIIFQCFDQVYFLYDGMCVYNGSTSNIVSFMSSMGYKCPITYSPSDYLAVIETVHAFKDASLRLASKIENGKINIKNSNLLVRRGSIACEDTENKEQRELLDIDYPTSFWTQFCTIFVRMMLQLKRNTPLIYLQTYCHVSVALIFGFFYYQMGNDGRCALFNHSLCICVMVFFIFTYLMPPTLLFPFEVKLLKREYANRWYGIKPYFLALTLKSLTLMVPLGTSFVLIVYLLSNQPLEAHRFIKFTITGLLIGLTTEGLGLAVGSVFSITNGSIVGPFGVVPWLLLSGHGFGTTTTVSIGMKILTYTSYLRYGLVALNQSIFGERRLCDCNDEEYCYFQDPNSLLKLLGVQNKSYDFHIFGLLGFAILFRLLAFTLLKLRLSSTLYRVVINYISRTLPINH